jgi:mRNA interferase HigB
MGGVRVISHKAIREVAAKKKEAAQPLDDWYRVVRRADWNNLAELRADYPRADLVGSCVVFNIGGNRFRLIAKVAFRRRIVYIRFILSHKEYDRGRWKDDCNC